MDIEGAELMALNGAKGILDRDHPSVLIEIHPTRAARLPDGVFKARMAA